jgi:hypothetical protein
MTKCMKPRSALRSRSTPTRSRAGPMQPSHSRCWGGSDVGAPAGLGAAIAKMTCEAAQDAGDARAMRMLRTRLDELMKRPAAGTLTRPNILSLFKCLRDGLRPSTNVLLGTLKTGEPILTDHPAIALLEEAIDAANDLDNGRTHEIFERVSHGANATLTAKQRKQDRIWLRSVEIVQRREGLPTKSAARRSLAVKLRKAGETRRGKHVTAQILKSLRDHSKKT